MTTLTMNNIIYLDPSVLVPHPQNPRPKSAFKKTNPKMQELIKSISEVDVIQPITVRALDKKTYQVVAGHRRYYAAKYAEKQIPALVRELDDASALALMLAENIQREDADPIMESRTIALLIDENNSLETVAARFGKSYSWAYKRAQLGKLSAKWIDAQTNGEINWSIDLLVVIARYATETQDALYDILIGHRYEDAYTIETLTQALAKFHHDISKTPWEAADADLLPEAGACSACTKRASCQQTLFDEMTIKKKGPDYCTDHLCWKKKSGLFVERKMIALKEKHGVEITKVSVDSYRPEDESIKGYQDYVKVKKTDPKARLAIVTDGPQEGATIWINDRHSYQSTKITAAKAARDLGKEPSQKALKEELGEKREALTKRRVLDAWHNLLRVLMTIKPEVKGKAPWKIEGKPSSYDEYEGSKSEKDQAPYPLPSAHVPVTNALIAWVVMHGVSTVDAARCGGLHAQKVLGEEKEHQHAYLWRACFSTMKQELDRAIAARELSVTIPQEIAALIGVDLNELISKSTEMIKEPKAWEVQYGELLTA